MLISRDSFCLLTGEDFEDCTAAHILPQSRPEVRWRKVCCESVSSLPTQCALLSQYYCEAMGFEPNTLFMPSFGLLVRDDLHHAFDRGQWALWPQVRETGWIVRRKLAQCLVGAEIWGGSSAVRSRCGNTDKTLRMAYRLWKPKETLSKLEWHRVSGEGLLSSRSLLKISQARARNERSRVQVLQGLAIIA
ncbi:hypothetical protein U1Q18_044744 [Sarracenia purpurea var. burkii]